MKIIGLSGGMGVGKSTALKIIGDERKNRTLFQLVKFAQPLYDMQEFIYDRISPVYERPKDFKKDRKLLQWLGTDWGRDISPSLWVDLWKDEVAAHKYHAYCLGLELIVICDDVRFDNEAEAIKETGGIIIKITRPNNTFHAEGGVGISNHKSELGVSGKLLDYTIENSDTIEAFRDKLVACLNELYKPVL